MINKEKAQAVVYRGYTTAKELVSVDAYLTFFGKASIPLTMVNDLRKISTTVQLLVLVQLKRKHKSRFDESEIERKVLALTLPAYRWLLEKFNETGADLFNRI